jgi:hypothetical protein
MILATTGLCIWTGLEATRCTIQLFQHVLTPKVGRVRLDECGDRFRRRSARGLQALHDAITGTFPKCQRCQHPVDNKLRTLDHDVEKARECEKESFEVPSSEESLSEDQGCHSRMTRVQLVRNLAGTLLLYPTCMLIMSNYALSRGLLQEFGDFESQVSVEFQKLSND